MLGTTWQIGRVFGIPIRLHASWFLVFAFVTWTLAVGYLPESLPGQAEPRYWGMAAAAALLLFVSVLLHELGHSAVALRYRIPIGHITLFVFGGVAHMQREPPRPRAECLIALAGPAVSFALAGGLFGAGSLMESRPDLEGVVVLTMLLGTVNLQLGVFNLIPGFPLDGGRVLRAALWAWSGDFIKATRLSAWAGYGVGGLIVASGALLLVGAASGSVPSILAANGSWIVILGLFLIGAARGSVRQAMLQAALSHLSVADVMIRNVVTLDGALTVEEAVSNYFLPHGFAAFPVTEEGRAIGLLTTAEIHAVPRSRWPSVLVRDTMQRWSASLETAPAVPIVQVMGQMIREGRSRLAVVDEGKLIGLVTRTGIRRALELKGAPR